MASLNEFSRRMAVHAGRISGNTTRLVRRVALAADQALVSGTPVDTGRARSNWIVQLNSAAGDDIDPYVPGAHGSTEAQNTQAALDQGEAVISGYVSGRDLSIHITNNVPYIGELNAGSSAQAPANFVEQALSEAVAAVNSSRIIGP